MKYKYIKIKYIIPSLLIIAILIVVGVFFIGGLTAKSIDLENIEWTTDGFIDMNTVDSTQINKTRVVGENSKYVMTINEDTTIVSVYEKKAAWDKNNPVFNSKTVKLLYSSAQEDGDNEAKSNVALEYYNADGKTTTISSFAKSVKYQNVTTGKDEKYYQLRYGTDDNFNNYVDVLYSIGDFSPVVIPDKFDLADFENMFIGNTVFKFEKESDIKSFAKIYDLDGNLTDEVGVEWKHADGFYCFDNEAALYILENGFGFLEFKENNKFGEGVKYNDSNVTDEQRAEILNAKNGYWDVSGVLDENGFLKMKAGIDYNTGVDSSGSLVSPVIVNPFLNQILFNTIFAATYYEVRDVNEDESYVTSDWRYKNSDVFQRVMKFKGDNSILVKQDIYNFLYVGAFTTEQVGVDADDNPIYDLTYDKHQYKTVTASGNFNKQNVYYDYNQDGKITVNEYYQYGGYQYRDETGAFVYEEQEDGSLRPKQMGLQTEEAVAQNEKFNFEAASKTIAFDICVRFTLTREGMDVTIINDSIREGVGVDYEGDDVPEYLIHDNLISKLQVCKYAIVNKSDTSTGQIVLPDGSGAIINFNSEKSEQYASVYPEKRIYGDDLAINRPERGNVVEKMMLPMFGFIETSDRKGVVAIVDKGAAQTSISADFLRDASKGGMMKYNYAFFTTYYRDSEKVTVTSNTEYVKVSEEFYQSDVIYKYIFLSTETPSTYVDVANTYRNYLFSKYPDLEAKSDTTKVSSPTITFLGAYEKKTFKMGFVYDAEYSLTTFDQASKIVDELNANGLANMNIAYRSWTEDEISQQTTADVKVSKEVGGKRDMTEFSSHLKSLGFGFYPEYKVANGRGYDFAFGNLKYSSKSISGSYSNSIEYVLSTGLEDATRGRGNFISPIYYSSLAEKFLKNYAKLDASGIYLSDLGNKTVADYSRGNQVYSSTATLYQRDALEVFKGEDQNLIMLNAPYDYSFEYVDVATVVPVQCTLYGAVNYSIPLYQLVCSGLFDYSSTPVNYQNDYSVQWNLLKAIETGSNVAFVLAAEDTSVLLDTQYTEYYNSYYTNWKENIIYMNSLLNSTGIYESYLVNHKYLTDNVVQVEYANGLTIIINYDSEGYYDSTTGYGVRSNWFAIIKEGE